MAAGTHRCAGETTGGRISYYKCQKSGTIEEQGKWWCYHHAPSLVAERHEERDDRERAADAHVARQRREAQRAEAVRIVRSYNLWRRGWEPLTSATDFSAYLYPEPEEAE